MNDWKRGLEPIDIYKRPSNKVFVNGKDIYGGIVNIGNKPPFELVFVADQFDTLLGGKYVNKYTFNGISRDSVSELQSLPEDQLTEADKRALKIESVSNITGESVFGQKGFLITKIRTDKDTGIKEIWGRPIKGEDLPKYMSETISDKANGLSHYIDLFGNITNIHQKPTILPDGTPVYGTQNHPFPIFRSALFDRVVIENRDNTASQALSATGGGISLDSTSNDLTTSGGVITFGGFDLRHSNVLAPEVKALDRFNIYIPTIIRKDTYNPDLPSLTVHGTSRFIGKIDGRIDKADRFTQPAKISINKDILNAELVGDGTMTGGDQESFITIRNRSLVSEINSIFPELPTPEQNTERINNQDAPLFVGDLTKPTTDGKSTTIVYTRSPLSFKDLYITPTTVEGYGIENVYEKTETDNLLRSVSPIADRESFSIIRDTVIDNTVRIIDDSNGDPNKLMMGFRRKGVKPSQAYPKYKPYDSNDPSDSEDLANQRFIKFRNDVVEYYKQLTDYQTLIPVYTPKTFLEASNTISALSLHPNEPNLLPDSQGVIHVPRATYDKVGTVRSSLGEVSPTNRIFQSVSDITDGNYQPGDKFIDDFINPIYVDHDNRMWANYIGLYDFEIEDAVQNENKGYYILKDGTRGEIVMENDTFTGQESWLQTIKGDVEVIRLPGGVRVSNHKLDLIQTPYLSRIIFPRSLTNILDGVYSFDDAMNEVDLTLVFLSPEPPQYTGMVSGHTPTPGGNNFPNIRLYVPHNKRVAYYNRFMGKSIQDTETAITPRVYGYSYPEHGTVVSWDNIVGIPQNFVRKSDLVGAESKLNTVVSSLGDMMIRLSEIETSASTMRSEVNRIDRVAIGARAVGERAVSVTNKFNNDLAKYVRDIRRRFYVFGEVKDIPSELISTSENVNAENVFLIHKDRAVYFYDLYGKYTTFHSPKYPGKKLVQIGGASEENSDISNKTVTFTPSSIKQGITTNETMATICGKLSKWYSSFSEVAWSGSWNDISNKPTTLSGYGITDASPISHTHTKSQITDFPNALPASDVHAWAKQETKPVYSWSEITNKPDIPNMDYYRGSSTHTSFSNIPTTKRIVVISFSQESNISLNGNIPIGEEIIICGRNTSSSTRSIPIPGNNGWVSLDGYMMTVLPYKRCEMSILRAKEDLYIISYKVES